MPTFGRSVYLIAHHVPCDQRLVLQNCGWVKDPFKVQDRPANFSVCNKSAKSSSVGFPFHRDITFKKLPFVKFWCRNKNIYSYKGYQNAPFSNQHSL